MEHLTVEVDVIEINVGDVVYLHSGGPSMTVANIEREACKNCKGFTDERLKVTTTWFDMVDHLHYGVFDVACLTPFGDDELDENEEEDEDGGFDDEDFVDEDVIVGIPVNAVSGGEVFASD